MKSLKGVDPKFLRNTLCLEARQEGPEEDAGQQRRVHECTCQGYQGPRQAQDPKQWQLQAQSIDLPTSLTPSLGNVLVPALPRISDSAGQRPRPRPRLKPRPRLQLKLRLQPLLRLRFPKVPGPPQRLRCRAFCLPG